MAITFPTVFQSAIATDPAATAAGYVTPTRYNQGCSVAGLSATVGAILFSTDATTLSQDTGFTWKAATGQGLVMDAGTATTNVAAMSLVRTNNNAAVATGVKWTFTDTSSATTFLPFQILGGVAGNTNLMQMDKSGNLMVGSRLQIGGTSSSFPGLRNTGSILDVVTADAASFAGVHCGTVIADGRITTALDLDLTEMTAPGGAANVAKLFAQDNGGGKTQLMVIFGSGAAIQLAIEV